ncbi:MAG TPA: 2-hydroxyacyl-CoA dehydratase family protein [Spirochaetota bacterium]|nr:2-hydroxyacyl-CoA dehydratase family protein [Spirochaetota bacterium]
MTAPMTGLAGLCADVRNELIEEAMGRGMIPLGYTCSMVPRALLAVGTLFPVRMRAPGVAGTECADVYLSSVICSYSRSLLEFALDGRYDFLGGWVFVACCDHLRRLCDNLEYNAKPDFSHTLDIPHRGGPAALEWTVEELRRLARAIERHFDVDMGDDAVRAAMVAEGELVDALRELGALRKKPQPPFSGTDYHRVLMAAQSAPPARALALVREFREAMGDASDTAPYRARFLLVGGSLDDPAYTAVIESQGGLVVADRYCTGSYPWLDPVDAGGDPFVALARQVLDGNRCPRMMEGFAQRVNYIVDLAREYAADGVIIQSIKFCDTWGVEASALVTALREAGVPVLRLEREYRQSGEGQLRTRVQAFIESMGK